MNIIEINVTQEDADNCKGYFSKGSCLLATSVKRQLKVPEVRVGGVSVSIPGFFGWYRISSPEKIRESYTRQDREVISSDFKPFTIVLTQAKHRYD